MAKPSTLTPIDLVGTKQVWVVCGANGTGKTTLLKRFLETGTLGGSTGPNNEGRASAGIDTTGLSTGQIRIGETQGKDWSRSHARVVAAFVDPLPLSRDLTIAEHLHLVSASWHGNTQTAADHTEQALRDFRIEHLRDRLPHQVSLGQGQLFNLALTFVRPSEVIVLDEPERHLDSAHTGILAAAIKDRSAASTAFLIATHEPQIVGIADTLIEL